MKHTKKEKIRIVLIPTLIVVLLVSLVSTVFKDWVTILENNKTTKQLSVDYDNLLHQEEKLKSEVTKLHDPKYVARYAKEKYFYSSDGEIIIRMD